MSRRAVVEKKKQALVSASSEASTVLGQIVLPLIAGIETTKQGLLAFVHQMGMLALHEMLDAEAAAIAGPKGKHAASRTHNHWGTTRTPLPFGGRHVVIERPRVRRRGGGEVALPTLEGLREADPLSARVAEQIVLGVSTRGYARSLEPTDGELQGRGTGKSSASRALIEKTNEKLAAFRTCRLDDLDVVAMFIDGIEVARKAVIIALGVTSDGTKKPLGLWSGSTENGVIATELLQDLVARGLRVDAPMLFVIDGGKGIRKALRDVFGDRAIVQRCQVHKVRNVRDHLPESRRAYVVRQMHDAYRSKSAKVAKKQLLQLATWLEKNGEDGAAGSLREGLDETLTVLRLELSKTLVRTLSTTNAIENLNGTLRRVCRNVKRWRGESMICRWIALAVGEAQTKFRRVKGHTQMKSLVAALRPVTRTMEIEEKVA
jgi:transposase-like protein